MTRPALSLKNLDPRAALRDALLVAAGSVLIAVGLNSFLEPNGLAPGGITGIAIIVRALVLAAGGPELPVGVQTLAMNAALMLLALRVGGPRYVLRSLAGVVLSAVAIDALAPTLPVLGESDLLLCALWGGVICGVGLGLVFKAGSNTGGTDILCQILARRTGVAVGTWVIVTDLMVVAASAPIFSVENAMYATVAMFLMGWVLDHVVDGPSSERIAWVISSEHEAIARAILDELDRGCTEMSATGKWTGERRPVLFVILGRGDIAALKAIVSAHDPDAIVVISEAHEAFGEGFRRLEAN